MEAVEGIIENMKKETKAEFCSQEFSKTERVKFLLDVSNELCPVAKHILYKNLLKLNSPAHRTCIYLVLGKLVEEDKNAKGLVKQVNL